MRIFYRGDATLFIERQTRMTTEVETSIIPRWYLIGTSLVPRCFFRGRRWKSGGKKGRI